MRYYEIRELATQRELTVTAKNYAEACKKLGVKPQHCKVVYSYKEEE